MSEFRCMDCTGVEDHVDSCVQKELARAIELYGFNGVHPMANLFPMMTAEERRGLTVDAKRDGWLHPVTLTGDRLLLDGRNRLVVSLDIELDVSTVRHEMRDDLEAFRFVFAENFHRRSLSAVQRAELAVLAEDIQTLAKAEARARMGEAGAANIRTYHAGNFIEDDGDDADDSWDDDEPVVPKPQSAVTAAFKVVDEWDDDWDGDEPSPAPEEDDDWLDKSESLVSLAQEPVPELMKTQSRDAAAAPFGITGKTMENMAAVMKEPDLLEEVRAGRKGIRPAAEEARGRLREREEEPAKPTKTLMKLLDHKGNEYDYAAPASKATFNTTNDSVDWARFTWNPVTGCNHGCFYCYAREIANQVKMRDSYPAGFTPLFHPERLPAPRNTHVPNKAETDAAYGRVFVGSMADLFGEWVPEEWIKQVFAACNEAPDWEYLFLTKFPKRYKRIDLPPSMWAGASVDSQKRVKGTEAAMRDLDVKVRWLSIEPLLEPLEFSDLSWCDLMVVGAQSATRQPEGPVPAFAPDVEWVVSLIGQARAAGVPIYLKENLMGETNSNKPGMRLLKEMPRGR